MGRKLTDESGSGEGGWEGGVTVRRGESCSSLLTGCTVTAASSPASPEDLDIRRTTWMAPLKADVPVSLAVEWETPPPNLAHLHFDYETSC